MNDPCSVCGPDFASWLEADPARQTEWRLLPRRRVDAGQMLQSAGQTLGTVWFVEQGLLRSHFLDGNGRERNCAFHPEAQWAGIPRTRGTAVAASYAIDALESSRVVELSHAALGDWLHASPELQARLTDSLTVNLMALSRRMSTLLMDSAEQRYRQFLAQQPDIATRVALHQVASYLGITNVALSRIRRRIRDRQLAG